MNMVDPAIRSSKAAGRLPDTSFVQISETSFAGHVFAPDDPLRKYTVALIIDGYEIRTTRADLPTHDLDIRTGGDGCHGFRFSLPPGAIEAGTTVETRIANLAIPVGGPIVIDPDHPSRLPSRNANGLTWLGGLRFSAWVAAGDAAAIEVLVDEQRVMQAVPTGWTTIPGVSDRPARLFEFHLPERFADGAAHRIAVNEDGGETFSGCPLPFVAFDDGLASTIGGFGGLAGERLRAELFDRLLPMSWPLARYNEWKERFPKSSAPAYESEVAVILAGDGVDDTIESLKAQTGVRWVAASLPAARDALGFAPELMRAFLAGDAAQSPIVVFAPSGTSFAPDALRRLAWGLEQSPDVFAAYGDLEVIGEDGTPWPLCFPAFDYERMLEQGYCSIVFALRRSHLERALDAGAATLFRLFNAQLDMPGDDANGIVHVPGVIASLPRLDLAAAATTLAEANVAHLGRRNTPAEVIAGTGAGSLPSVRVVRRQASQASVAIVVVTDGDSDALRGCLAALRPNADRPDTEIIVADTGYCHPRVAAVLAESEGVPATVVTVDGPFNPARMANLAARSTERDYLCLIADDVTATEAGWLDELLARSADPCVGAVGPLVMGEAGLVYDAGVVLGPGFAAAPAFADAVAEGAGYGGMLAVAHQRSALAMGCLLTWRGDYLGVGGMDEIHFPLDFADVDFCLKLRAASRRIVMTPHARVRRSGRRPSRAPHSPGSQARALDMLRARWGEAIAADPCYSPLLSLDPVPYSALAWPPRSDAPRRAEAPTSLPVPEGF